VRPHRESWLRIADQLSADAAQAFLRTGDRHGALRALEAGRAVLLSETLLVDGAGLDRLAHAGHGALAARYRQLADRLAWLENPREDTRKPRAGLTR
jgi:hypothetical protein